MTPPNTPARAALPATALRWRCPEDELGFTSTDEVDPIPGIIGQDAAVEALRFGLTTDAPGHNVFVRGLTGSGRMTLLRHLIEEIGPMCRPAPDRCYVRNFAQPDRPLVLTLSHAHGRAFRALIDELRRFVRDDLAKLLKAESMQVKRAAIDDESRKRFSERFPPFEAELEKAGLGLARVDAGPVARAVIVPIIEGEPVPPEAFLRMRAEGTITNERFEQVAAEIRRFEPRLQALEATLEEIRRAAREALAELTASDVHSLLAPFLQRAAADFPGESISRFVRAIIADVAERRIDAVRAGEDVTERYRVNLILDHTEQTGCPLVVENVASAQSLLGSIEVESGADGPGRPDHMSIRAGSLLRADGGFLIVDVRDLLSNPDAWRITLRTLRTGVLEIGPESFRSPWEVHSLKPEPIEVRVKVVLVGSEPIFSGLDVLDQDFPHLFKVVADFDSTLPRTTTSMRQIAGVLSRIARDDGLPRFEAGAVAALIEHAARIAAHRGRLTSRLGRVCDIAREAAYVTRERRADGVERRDVWDAIERTKRRANLPARRFRELVHDGTIKIDVTGRAVGQVNGLAVIRCGPLTYGFPQRITSTIGPGTAGVVNIEREAELSGAIHTKGFYILGGLLRRLLGAQHPLAFEASVAFEQSYGGIDGDSASSAEICCLLSALTDIPLRQDLALTGAIDQVGHVMAVGAVTEKVEGFFDVCADRGLTGSQGCVIPSDNASDLALREDVVEACTAGRFHVYAVHDIREALELVTGRPAGERDEHGEYPAGSVLREAVRRAAEFWRMAQG